MTDFSEENVCFQVKSLFFYHDFKHKIILQTLFQLIICAIQIRVKTRVNVHNMAQQSKCFT